MEAVLIEKNDTTTSFTQKIYDNVRDYQGNNDLILNVFSVRHMLTIRWILNISHIATMLSDLPFAGSPVPVILLLLFYLLIVKKIGPALMEYKKPYNPRKWIMAYNICQIIGNAYMFYYVMWQKKFNFIQLNDSTIMMFDFVLSIFSLCEICVI